MKGQKEPIQITPNMPPNVAAVARMLNYLKISPEPESLPVSAGSSSLFPGEQLGDFGNPLLRKFVIPLIQKRIDFTKKRLIDIGCGHMEATGMTTLLASLFDLNVPLSGYVALDPALEISGIMADESTKYIASSPNALTAKEIVNLGKFDLAFTSGLFGVPIAVGSRRLNDLIRHTLDQSGFIRKSDFLSCFPEFSAIANPLAIPNGRTSASGMQAGITADFMEFLIQDFIAKVLLPAGHAIHLVQMKEDPPDPKIASAAGLSLIKQESIVISNCDCGSLSIFRLSGVE